MLFPSQHRTLQRTWRISHGNSPQRPSSAPPSDSARPSHVGAASPSSRHTKQRPGSSARRTSNGTGMVRTAQRRALLLRRCRLSRSFIPIRRALATPTRSRRLCPLGRLSRRAAGDRRSTITSRRLRALHCREERDVGMMRIEARRGLPRCLRHMDEDCGSGRGRDYQFWPGLWMRSVTVLSLLDGKCARFIFRSTVAD